MLFKKLPLKKILLSVSLLFTATWTQAISTQCLDKTYTLQLLGSGGPIPGDSRAQSGSLLWLDGKSRVLIDMGEGVFLRFSQSGAQLPDLYFVGITHFHTDHSADLAPFIKSAYFVTRKTALPMAGPGRRGPFPSLTEYLQTLFNPNTGAYAYLTGVLNGTDGFFRIIPVNVNPDTTKTDPVKVFENKQLSIWALSVPHGDVPCLAYRINSPRGSIVISGDQNGTNPGFIPFSKGADVLVMPMAIDEQTNTDLHAKPSTIGQIAQKINPRMLILYHLMGSSLVKKDQSVKIIKQYYKGYVFAGRDLECFPLPIDHKKEQPPT